MSKGNFEHATDRIQHETSWDAWASEHAEQYCHVVGCRQAWIKDTGNIIVLSASKRNAKHGYATFLVCAKHDDEDSICVDRGGATVSINT